MAVFSVFSVSFLHIFWYNLLCKGCDEMATNYARNLFKQFEEALIKIDEQSLEIKCLKSEISALKSDHQKEVKCFEKEINQLNINHKNEIDKLNKDITSLKAENKRLRNMIDKDSSNSSKPPSTDGFKEIPNSRVKTGKRPGGQKGHKGATLKLFPNPTKIVTHKKKCGCGGKVNYTDQFTAKQAVDIVITTNIVEHRAYSGTCTCCGKCVQNKFPENLKNPVNYGENSKSLATLLTMEGAVSIGRTVQILEEITGGLIKFSHGTIANFHRELSRKLAPAMLEIKDNLFASPVLCKDETGIKINGEQHWFHVTSNDFYTFYLAHKKRGKDADFAINILNDFSGTLMHDHLIGLYHFKCSHAECNAHGLRYLKSAHQQQDREWAVEMISFLVEVHRKRKALLENGESAFATSEVAAYFTRYDEILENGKKEFLLDEKPDYNGDDMKLLRRLAKFKKEHLMFITDFRVPFDNNLAERDLRMVKAKTKISGGFRSYHGAEEYAVIKSYLSTLRKNKRNLFEGIKLAFLNTPIKFGFHLISE